VSGREEIDVLGRPELSHAADAVLTHDHVFVAGVLPVGTDGTLVGRDTVEQAEFVFGELAHILAAAACTPADVVKLTVYLTNIDDRPRINPARQRFSGSARPASTLVEVSGLAVPGALIEVDAVAALP
jgi:2-iminobutanoate/2-iminopropanoate deaminase